MSRKMIRTYFVITLATCLSASSSGAAILHVPGDYATIQEAVDAAVNGDRIEVASVPFAEDVSVVDKDLQVVAVASPIVVRSISWTNPNAAQTPVGGYVEGFDVTGDVIVNGLPLSFTATDLNVDGVIDIAAQASSEDTPIYVVRCTSTEGISAVASGIDTPNVGRITISECETGGSISARSRVGRVEGCVVPNGSIRVSSRWASAANDNVVTGDGILLVADANLTANHNVVRGGGISCLHASYLEAEYNSILDSPVGIDFGGGYKAFGTFVGNLIVRCGEGIISPYGSLEAYSNTIVNCSSGLVSNTEFASIEQNVVVGCGAGMALNYPAHSVACNDVWNNVFNWYGPDPTGMNGNISIDPLFCDAAEDDYTLSAPSGCLPGNHPDGAACGIIGALGEGCSGPVPTIDTSWGRVKSRFQE